MSQASMLVIVGLVSIQLYRVTSRDPGTSSSQVGLIRHQGSFRPLKFYSIRYRLNVLLV